MLTINTLSQNVLRAQSPCIASRYPHHHPGIHNPKPICAQTRGATTALLLSCLLKIQSTLFPSTFSSSWFFPTLENEKKITIWPGGNEFAWFFIITDLIISDMLATYRLQNSCAHGAISTAPPSAHSNERTQHIPINTRESRPLALVDVSTTRSALGE